MQASKLTDSKVIQPENNNGIAKLNPLKVEIKFRTDAELVVGLAKAIQLYLQQNEKNTLFINGENIISFIRQKQLLLNNRTYKFLNYLMFKRQENYYGLDRHEDGEKNFQIDTQKEKNDLFKVCLSDSSTNNSSENEIRQNKDKNNNKEVKNSERGILLREDEWCDLTGQPLDSESKRWRELSLAKNSDNEEPDNKPQKPLGVTLIQHIYWYLQRSINGNNKLDFNIQDEWGYTPLGVAILHMNVYFLDPMFEPQPNPHRDGFKKMINSFFQTSAHYNIKLTPDLRIVKNKKYLNFLDVILSSRIFMCDGGYVNYRITIDYGKRNETPHNSSQYTSCLLNHYRYWQDTLNYLDLTGINSKDLVLACFLDERIFKDLVSCTEVSELRRIDPMEYVEYSEDCKLGNIYYLSRIGDGFSSWGFTLKEFKRIQQLLIKRELFYETSKLNPITGSNAIISSENSFYNIHEESLQIIVEMAKAAGKPIDFNHLNDFGLHFLNWVKSPEESMNYWFKLAKKEKIVLNLDSYVHIDTKNLEFCRKLTEIQSWTFGNNAVKPGDLGYKIFSSPDFPLALVWLTLYTAKMQKTPIQVTAKEAHDLILRTIKKEKNLEKEMMCQGWDPSTDKQIEKKILEQEITLRDVLFELLFFCYQNKVDPKISDSPVDKSSYVEYDAAEENDHEENDQEKKKGELADKISSEQEQVEESINKLLLYVLVYECVFCNYQLSEAKDLIFLPKASIKMSSNKATLDQSLGKLLSTEHLPIFTEVLSELFAYFINEWRYFIRYAEENEITLDLTADYQGKSILELAAESDKIITFNAILAYAARNNIKIDMARKNNDGDTLIDLVLNDKERLSALVKHIDCNPTLVNFDEKNKYEALRVLGQYDLVWKFYDTKTDPDSLYVKSKVLQDQKKIDQALELSNIIIKNHANFADGYYSKAILLLDQGKCYDALELLDIAITTNPHNPLYDINKVKIFLDLGLKEKAIETLEAIDIKVATRYINRLFTPGQKELFIQLTQVTEKFITRLSQEKNTESERSPIVFAKIIQAFNSGIKINFNETTLLKAELEKVKSQLLNVHQKMDAVQTDLANSKMVFDKRLLFVEQQVNHLESWLNQLHKNVADFKPENEEMKEKIKLLQDSLQNSLSEQAKQQTLQKSYQQQLALLQDQIETMQDVKKAFLYEEKIKLLEDELTKSKKTSTPVEVAVHLKALQEDFLNLKKSSEQVAKINSTLRSQLQNVIHESDEKAKQFMQWQNELTERIAEQTKQQDESLNLLSAQVNQTKMALNKRMAMLEQKTGPSYSAPNQPCLFFTENTIKMAQHQSIEEKNSLKTLDDGNCFFHACFGELIKNQYIATNAPLLRGEWARFLSQFSSLNDSIMPVPLRSFLENVLETILDNPHQSGVISSKEVFNLILTTKMKISQAEIECKTIISNIKNKILQGDNFIKPVLNELINLMIKSLHPISQEIIKMLMSKTRQTNQNLTEVNLIENYQTFLQIATKDATYLDNLLFNNVNRFAIAYDPKNYPNEKQFNEKLNTRSILKEFLYNKTVYQVYLEAISRNSYYIYTEEIPILASLSGVNIHLWYNDKDGKCHEQVFAPDAELIKWINTHFQKVINTPWNKTNEVHIYHEGFDEKGNASLSLHYSRTNPEAFKSGFSHNTSSQTKKG